MYELKKNGKVFRSKSVGTGPSSYEKRIYRVGVSQRLRSTALNHWSARQQEALTCAQIHAGEQTTDPRCLPLSFPEELNKLPQEDAESIGYAVDDHVAHKTGEYHDPAIPAIWGWWQIMVFAIWGTLFIRRATFGVSSNSTVRCEG